MEKNIIFFTGKARSGKNHVSCCLKKELEQQGYKVCELAFADLLKEYICTVFDLDLDELNRLKNDNTVFTENGLTMREVLQRFGTELFRNRIDRDYWIKVLAKRITKSNYDYYLVTDLRFPNELHAVTYCANYDTTGCAYRYRVVKILCTSNEQVGSQHLSENSFDEIHADVVIDNTDHKYKFNIKDFF